MIRTLLLGAGSLALGLAAVSAQSAPTPAPTIVPGSASAGDWGDFGIQTRWIDPKVKPGDDFNEWANGQWLATYQIPADRTRFGSFDELAELSQARIHGLLDGLVANRPAPGTQEARIVAAYQAYMDEGAIERAGLAPARPWLDRIAAAHNEDDLIALFAAPGFASPVDGGVSADPRQSDRYILGLGVGGLGLPDRDYYLSDNPRFPEIRAKYKAYVAMMLREAGYPEAEATAKAADVYALETDLAKASWDRTALRDAELTYHKLTAAQVAAMPEGGRLRRFLVATGPEAAAAQTVLISELTPTPAELAAARITPEEARTKIGGGVPAALALIGQRPIDTWKAWLTARFLSDHAGYLPKRLDDARFEFYGRTLQGQPQQKVRWKRGIAVVESQLGEQLGRLYAARYFPEANREAMADLVGNLRKAMAANLATLNWMGPETRKEALAKLAAFTSKIGAPATFKTYEGQAVSPTDPLANAMASARWQSDFQLARIGKPVDKSEWVMLPETVNAYYEPTNNEIVFPAAILQPPFFNISADPAVNYGGIGAVIGHEMGHGFDDQGAKSDGAGNLRDWWTAADKARFVALTDRLVDQYNHLCPFDNAQTCVNGRLTLGENIGDLGGLSLAYRAYKLSLHGKPAPVIDGYTGDQRFFMSWAQVWRSKVREQMARQYLLVDPHSPPMYRINGIVRNFDEWYRAFGVKPGDKLYLPPAQRIRIW